MKTAFFAAKTLNGLPSDNFEALAVLCAEFDRFDGFARQLPEHQNDYVEALSILRGFAMARDAKVAPFPELGPQRHQNVSKVVAYFGQLPTVIRKVILTPRPKNTSPFSPGPRRTSFPRRISNGSRTSSLNCAT